MRARGWGLSTPLLAMVLTSACGVERDSGTFEKSLAVDGVARLDIENGSGTTQVRPGRAGEVRVRGEFRVQSWLWNDPSEIARRLRESPPVRQSGNTIRIGREWRDYNAVIDYVITVPPETEISASSGSGGVDVQGVRGPSRLRSGSGRIMATDIGDDVDATTGSGTMELTRIEGAVRASSGSGRINIENAGRQIRVETGSGRIQLLEPAGPVQADSGSGSVEVRGAKEDLRIDVSSGRVTVWGNPAPRAFWEIKTRSGGVELEVPANASFTLSAETSSARIHADIPIDIVEQGRRRIRGRVGAGAARVQVQTRSGSITIR